MEEAHRKAIEQKLARSFVEQVPFHRTLGLTEESFDFENGTIKLSTTDELVGNPIFKILHGGAIAALLDIEGAFLIALDVVRNRRTSIQKGDQLGKGGTIDMRIDYIMPGKGSEFTASGAIVRLGNKVAVIRSELHNERGELIAMGTATYLIA